MNEVSTVIYSCKRRNLYTNLDVKIASDDATAKAQPMESRAPSSPNLTQGAITYASSPGEGWWLGCMGFLL